MWDLSKPTTWIKLLAGLVAGIICALMIILERPNLITEFVAVVIVLLVEGVAILVIDGHHLVDFLSGIGRNNELVLKHIDQSKKWEFLSRYCDRDWEPEKVPDIWIEFLSSSRQSYFGTNYIKTDRIYTFEWAKAGLALQKARKLMHPEFSIQKVFIIDNVSEIADLSFELEAQRAVHIDAEYLYHHEIETATISRWNVPSVDFGIFDMKHVLSWVLKDRDIKKGRAFLGEESVSNHRKLFDSLYLKAQGHRSELVLLDFRADRDRQRVREWPECRPPQSETDHVFQIPGAALHQVGASEKYDGCCVYEGGKLVGICVFKNAGNGGSWLHCAVPFQTPDHELLVKVIEKAIERAKTRRINKLGLKVQLDRAEIFEHIGFVKLGLCQENVNGKIVKVQQMEMVLND